MDSSTSPRINCKKSKKSAWLITIGVISLIIVSVVTSAIISWAIFQQMKPASSARTVTDGNTKLTEEEIDTARVAEKVSASVVSIITSGKNDEDQISAGTGVIISADGYILTNKHVVENARGFEIVTNAGDKYSDVVMVGADPLNDIAFLKIKDAKNMPTVEFGNSSTVKIGQKVIAIGNSLGQYQNTVTSGIISGKGRPVSAAKDSNATEVESLVDLLQTDAAINPGNSGGPLINASGQVIGINTAIASDAQNIGFAIPINSVKGMAKSVLAGKGVQKAYVGVKYMSITPEVRAKYSLSSKTGAYVGGLGEVIEKNSPADKAGIKKGDIITKINDKTIGVDGGLSTLISEHLPGEKVTATILRDNKQLELELTLSAYQS